MKRIKFQTSIVFITILLIISACTNREKSNDALKNEAERTKNADMQIAESKTPVLIKKWETPQELSVPESVCYDKDRKVLYVANINGKPSEKDGNGFISKISLDGEIIEKEWIKGLDAPKGMGVSGDLLFVTNIDEVAEINIENNKIVNRYKVESAQFLNDITVGNEGSIYISDMATKKVHQLKNGEVSTLVADESFISTNGLYFDGKNLLVGIRNAIMKVNPTDGTFTKFIENTGGIDGLEAVGDGSYIISDWSGAIHIVFTDKEKVKILDTTVDKINAADIEFIPDEQILFVPTFGDNRVMAYALKVTCQ